MTLSDVAVTADEGYAEGGVNMETIDRIEVNAGVCSGKPVIRRTRIMMRNILGMIAGGYSIDRILSAYPGLSDEDVAAALEYAARVVDTRALNCAS